ncbi:MAG: multicopper oxidase domain-containing protein [Candidatus Bathyarchaeota archaeon]|nr:MAG: multicopper oxidase domain-containing protein [Candidatus Bathyarchaeota archaeon]
MVIACSAVLTLLTAYTLVPLQYSATAQAVVPLDPLTIPKFVNQLMGPPPVYDQIAPNEYAVDMVEIMQQVLPPGFPQTKVWGYGGQAKDAVSGAPLGYIANSPGPSFEVTKGIPIRVNWTNLITTPLQFAVDPTLHWANPNNLPHPYPPPFPAFPPGDPGAQSPVPLVTHLHGGEVPPESDGGPDAWWTSTGIQGPGYSSAAPTSANSAVYDYPNINPASTLWYHDHALGITRLNVMSGLAGFYIVRDPADTLAPILPTGKYDMPLVFQDRSFFTDGSFNFPSLGVQPAIHPYWIPEFFGDTIMVNGLVWPNMDVDQAAYRFRLLDGSNARFYTIQFIVQTGALAGTVLPFTQIASDGGYLTAPVTVTKLTFAPGERVEILVDFSGLAAGDTVLLKNTAKENFPAGASVNPRTVGQLMQFTVVGNPGPAAPTLPALLNPTLPTFPTLLAPRVTRILTLVEVLDPVTGVPLELLLDGQRWDSPVTELTTVGDTEEWWVINPTADSHPIHLHLVQFQVISRQKIDTANYYPDWLAANGGTLPLTAPTVNLNPYNYLKSRAKGPDPSEMGWKDTVMMHPGELTTIRIRFAPVEAPISGPGSPVPGTNPYDPTFDPTAPHGPLPVVYGYVWHCHILDHEDNEMMRPLQLTNTTIPAVPPPVPPPKGKPPK